MFSHSLAYVDQPPLTLDRVSSVIVAIICQLYYASQTFSSTDSTFDTWTVAVSTQVTQALSIVTACSPQFKPFLDNLQSSGMGLGMTSSNDYGSKHKTYGFSSFMASRRTQQAQSENHELVSMPQTHQAMVTSTPDDDSESQSSRANIIVETRTWTVTEGFDRD